ncbi:MAG: 50S ribosomal protein L5 [Candidatus Chaera renei]|uniref:Large ribosomal subunit protein uL5 n=1 Tax=Candidatus Chaera renei TaxID=2506947 RepID=A0A4Q0AJJ3_9BACT|nr:MAG: 50S ribosomal protein L5 [Candidatus Chaera renei]
MPVKSAPAYQARLKQLYVNEIRPQLQKELGLANLHQVPRLEKIVVAVGTGRHKDDKSYHGVVVNTLRKITGQQPVDRLSRKSIASFKIRAGQNRIGVSVTLRGDRMYEFFDRLVSVALPRVRDFHGVSLKSFDQSGNYSLGVADQSIFPELTFEDIQTIHGLQITLVLKSAGVEHSRALLARLGLPLEKEEKR